MKIYTRAGDTGETGLIGAGRVRKDHPRVEALGTIDELNASIGDALADLGNQRAESGLATVQHDLFTLGSHLASAAPHSDAANPNLPSLPTSRPGEMEAWIDAEDARLKPLTDFILPGGSLGARRLHVCRTICRRAERRVAALQEGEEAVDFAVLYLNRLSDLLFMLARSENQIAGVEDVHWESDPA